MDGYMPVKLIYVIITDLNFKVVMTQSGNGSYTKSCCKRHGSEQEGKLYFLSLISTGTYLVF